MEIRWHGLSCFTVKGDKAKIVIDPYDKKYSGLKLPKLEADIVLANEKLPFHYAVSEVSGDFELFDWAGEYEGRGVNVIAVPAYNKPKSEEKDEGPKAEKNVLIYSFEVDEIRICHLSNITHKLADDMSDAVGDVDILLVPIGGNGLTLDAEKAHNVIEQIEPRIVIPMYYNLPGMSFQLAPLNDFLKEVGQTDIKRDKVFKIKKRSDLPVDKVEFFVLEPTLG